MSGEDESGMYVMDVGIAAAYEDGKIICSLLYGSGDGDDGGGLLVTVEIPLSEPRPDVILRTIVKTLEPLVLSAVCDLMATEPDLRRDVEDIIIKRDKGMSEFLARVSALPETEER